MVSKKTKAKNGFLLQSSGRRKSASAKLTMYEGKGNVRINSQLLNTANYSDYLKLRIMEPILLAEEIGQKFDYFIRVSGGGMVGQADSVRLAIGRVLVQQEKKLEKTFLAYDRHLLVADVRVKEAYKPNDSKARAARQKSYR